jgi:hypothetical protein
MKNNGYGQAVYQFFKEVTLLSTLVAFVPSRQNALLTAGEPEANTLPQWKGLAPEAARTDPGVRGFASHCWSRISGHPITSTT